MDNLLGHFSVTVVPVDTAISAIKQNDTVFVTPAMFALLPSIQMWASLHGVSTYIKWGVLVPYPLEVYAIASF